MKTGNFISQLYQERRFDVLVLCLAAFFPLYKSFTNVVMLALLGIATIEFFRRSRMTISAQSVRYGLISSAFYLVMVFSLIYSSDVTTGLNFVVANAYLLLYPAFILVFGRDIQERHLNFILSLYTGACVVLAAYLHGVFFRAGLYHNFGEADYTTLPFRDVSVANDFHPTYVSMWFLFACLYILVFLIPRWRHLAFWIHFSGVMVVIFLIGTSILLSVKITTIAFAFACVVLIFKMLTNKVAVWLSLFLFIGAFLVAVTQLSFLRTRFVEEFKATEIAPPVGLATNSLNLRVGIYLCSWDVISQNWLIGTGIGDAQHALDDCYNSYSTNAYKERVYNTHNNYLGIAVSTGMIGLALFLFMLLFHLTRSIAYENLLFLLFLVFVMTVFMAENILSRNHGVVFYSLFCSLFTRLNLQRWRLSGYAQEEANVL